MFKVYVFENNTVFVSVFATKKQICDVMRKCITSSVYPLSVTRQHFWVQTLYQMPPKSESNEWKLRDAKYGVPSLM